MTAIRKTTAAITTAVLLGAGFAAPASADSAWLSDFQVRQQGGIIAPKDTQPVNHAYFADHASGGHSTASADRTAGNGDAAWLSTFEARQHGKIVGPDDPKPIDQAYFRNRGNDRTQQALAGNGTSYPTKPRR